MNCRTWPPFYEKEIDGKCVSTPPPVTKNTTYDIAGFAFVLLLVIGIPLIVISKAK